MHNWNHQPLLTDFIIGWIAPKPFSSGCASSA